MPYIKGRDREAFEIPTPEIPLNTRIDLIEELGDRIDNCGELNYVVTRLAHIYLREHGERYQNYNDIIGALEGAKLELYRRKVAPYEDLKIKSNGDV